MSRSGRDRSWQRRRRGDGLDGAGLEVGVEVGLPEAQAAAGVGELDAPFSLQAVDQAPAAAEVVGGAVDIVEAVTDVRRRSGAAAGPWMPDAQGSVVQLFIEDLEVVIGDRCRWLANRPRDSAT